MTDLVFALGSRPEINVQEAKALSVLVTRRAGNLGRMAISRESTTLTAVRLAAKLKQEAECLVESGHANDLQLGPAEVEMLLRLLDEAEYSIWDGSEAIGNLRFELDRVKHGL